MINFASQNDETPFRIASLLLARCGDWQGKELGQQVWSGSRVDKIVSEDSATAILVDCALGRETYGRLRKILKREGHYILPPWINLRRKQSKLTLEIEPLTDPHIGVHFPFTKSMQLTAERIFEGTPSTQLPSSAVMDIKYGCDGSVSHAIYRQLNYAQTNNMVMTMFCPLKVESNEGKVLWEQKSPLTHRPLMLEMGKESIESLQSLAMFNKEQTDLQVDGCKIEISGIEMPL